MHSQNRETEIVLNYFKDFKGTVLDIGANDGITFSNSFDLIEQGWKGILLEPGSVYKKASNLYRTNSEKVKVFNFGIGLEDTRIKFYESGAHIPNGSDEGLVSSSIYGETEKWRNSGVEFKEVDVQLMTFNKFYKMIGSPKIEFISIDCEGEDWNILQQIDLKEVGCKCLCIEWNGVEELENLYKGYCSIFGMKEIHRNAENIILAK